MKPGPSKEGSMQVIKKKRSQRLFLKGGVEGKLQERQGIRIQVKALGSLFVSITGTGKKK